MNGVGDKEERMKEILRSSTTQVSKTNQGLWRDEDS